MEAGSSWEEEEGGAEEGSLHGSSTWEDGGEKQGSAHLPHGGGKLHRRGVGERREAAGDGYTCPIAHCPNPLFRWTDGSQLLLHCMTSHHKLMLQVGGGKGGGRGGGRGEGGGGGGKGRGDIEGWG